MPLDAFYRDPPVEEADDFLTLARLWSEIEDGQARQRVLILARQEAKHSARRACA